MRVIEVRKQVNLIGLANSISTKTWQARSPLPTFREFFFTSSAAAGPSKSSAAKPSFQLVCLSSVWLLPIWLVKLIIDVNLLSDKILNFPSISKSSPWVEIHLSSSTTLWLFLTRHWSFLFGYFKSLSQVTSVKFSKSLFSDWDNCSRINVLVVEAIKKKVYSPGKISNISLVLETVLTRWNSF